ncbi:MAG: hypothetical protein U0105_12950 [Candidatus Obscuribacterales bacterium]
MVVTAALLSECSPPFLVPLLLQPDNGKKQASSTKELHQTRRRFIFKLALTHRKPVETRAEF